MKNMWTGLLVATLTTLPAQAQDVQDAQDTSEGESLYTTYCATCHGLNAEGNGPMGPALLLQPTDLTMLQSENEGDFPLVRVIRRIDGRDPLVGHGSPMPVFGDFFEGRDVPLKTKSGQPIFTSQPVAEIIAWLRTVQK